MKEFRALNDEELKEYEKSIKYLGLDKSPRDDVWDIKKIRKNNEFYLPINSGLDFFGPIRAKKIQSGIYR